MPARPDLAIEQLERIVKDAPTYYRAYFGLAVELETTDKRRALRCYQTFIAHAEPGSERYKYAKDRISKLGGQNSLESTNELALTKGKQPFRT